MSNKKNLDEKFLNACSLYENHDFDGSMEIFNELLLADYDVDTILPYLIKFYLRNNDTNKVLEYLDNYLDDNSSLYELLILKASILLKKYKANESLEIANKILEKDSLNDSAIMIKLASLKLLGEINEIKSFQKEIGVDLISDEELSHFNNNSTINNNNDSKIQETEDLGFVTADSLVHGNEVRSEGADSLVHGNGVRSEGADLDEVGGLGHVFDDRDLSFVTANNLDFDDSFEIKDNSMDSKNNRLSEKEDSNYHNIINDFISSMDNNIYDVDNFNEDNSSYDENQEEYTNSDISLISNDENLNGDINNNKVDSDIQEDESITNNLIDDSFNKNDSEELTTFEIEDIDIPIITEDYSKDFNKDPIDIDSLFNFDENGNLIDDISNENDEISNYSSDIKNDDLNSSKEYFNESNNVCNESSKDDFVEFNNVCDESESNDLNSSITNLDKNSSELNSIKNKDSSKNLNYHSKNKHFNNHLKMHNLRESTLDSFFNFQ